MVVIWLQLGENNVHVLRLQGVTTGTYITSCCSKIQNSLTSGTYPGCPRNWSLNKYHKNVTSPPKAQNYHYAKFHLKKIHLQDF